MIKIIILLAVALNLYANIEISQKMKALYKNVTLNEAQENYIFDNQGILKRLLRVELEKRVSNFKKLNEKNIIKFTIKPDGTISEITFLQKSGNTQLDRKTKKAIETAAQRFPRPKEQTEMRYIIKYEANKKYKNNLYQQNQNKTPSYPNIQRGTTRFQYNSKEYIRELETSEDGFINIKSNGCANLQLLTTKNQIVKSGYNTYRLYGPVNKGKYKLLIQTKKECDIHVQYP